MIVREASATETKGSEVRDVTEQSSDAARPMMNFARLISQNIFAKLFAADRAADAPFIFGLGQELRFDLSILRQLRAMAFGHLLEPSPAESIMGHDGACPSTLSVAIGIA
jgi:hypothetical protein